MQIIFSIDWLVVWSMKHKIEILKITYNKNTKYSVHYNVSPRKKVNCHIVKPGTIKCLAFLLEMISTMIDFQTGSRALNQSSTFGQNKSAAVLSRMTWTLNSSSSVHVLCFVPAPRHRLTALFVSQVNTGLIPTRAAPETPSRCSATSQQAEKRASTQIRNPQE